MVIAPTRAMLDALRAEYGPLGDSRVIPNARAGIRRRYVPASGKSELVFAAGRLWDQAKNVDALCEVAPLLRWPVCVAGDRGTEPARDAAGAVRWLGRLPGDAIAGWYGRAAIYALPARYEPFGLSVLEAAAAGCALVLGDVPSLRENWDGAARFVPPDNRRALAEAINELIADPAGRAALAERAASRARRFTVARMAAGYTRAYRQQVTDPRRSSPR
jgi:glycosyltransferase involved in cell wall biosynthesis